MITNQSNEGYRQRILGQNERASSTSSGPKYTSSISELLVNRGNTMRFSNQVSQSHQTSQNQLLTQVPTHPQNPSSIQLHTPIQAAPQPNGAEGGGRLMMKLMNIGVNHHQPTLSNISASGAATAHTFDHPRLSGSREDQKRLALDECTNYLQQKTMQQHFPSTSMAINNIINSNRSISSAGIPGQLGAPNNGQTSSTSNAAKKFQAFKFNLTLNKGKALVNAKGVEPPPPAQNIGATQFYQAQDIIQNSKQQQQATEDSEAIVINEKHRKQMMSQSRSGSNQQAMKEHLKQMIKSYEDQPQPLNSTVNPNNVVGEGTQVFDNTYHHETQKIQHDPQFTYDNTFKMGVQAQTNPARQQLSGKPIDKKVMEMDERQKIFEEEIIKRVKEIQNYAKTLHMQLKKMQSSAVKKAEDIQAVKDQLLQLKDHTMGSGDRDHFVTESTVSEMVDKRVKLLDTEINIQNQQLESKLVKDYDAKIQRLAKQNMNELQVRTDAIRDEVFAAVNEELHGKFKNEIMKQVTEKLSQIGKAQERNYNELKEVLNEKSSIIDQLMIEQQAMQKDSTSKYEKLLKGQKDTLTQMEEANSALAESLRQEIDGMKKKVMRDIKLEIEAKHYCTQVELQESGKDLTFKIGELEAILSAKMHDSASSQQKEAAYQHKLKELEDDFNGQLRSLEQDLSTSKTKFQSQEDKIKYIQEAYLQLKSHVTALSSDLSTHQQNYEASLQQFAETNESNFNELRDEVNDLKQQVEANSHNQQTNVDLNQLEENILVQIQPQFTELNERQMAVQQQIELVKQQLSQKLMRSELQEVKQDIDEEIKSLQRLFKKQDERVQATENAQSGLRSHLAQIESDMQSQISDLQGRQSNDKAVFEAKIGQLSESLQSKTNDLFEEIELLQNQLQSSKVNTVQQEASPERRSRLEAQAAVKATLDNHIEETKNHFEETSQQLQIINDKLTQFENFTSKEEMSKLMSQTKEDLTMFVQSSISPLKEQQQSFTLQFNNYKATIDEQFDDTIAKVNELDGRVSQLEEKDFKSMVTEEDGTKDFVSADEIAALKEQINGLKQLIQEKFESLESQTLEIENVKDVLSTLKNKTEEQEDKANEELTSIKQDIQNLFQLNTCIQEVTVNQSEFAEYKEEQQARFDEKLQTLVKENIKLQESLQKLQVQFQDQQETLNQQQQNKAALQSDLEKLRKEYEDRLKSIQTDHLNVVKRIDNLESQRLIINQDQPRSREDEQTRRSLDAAVTTGKAAGQQVGINFLTTPRAYDSQSPDQHARQQRNGHFLEDLSEVVSSPNNFAHNITDADMMIFNNRQSISSASMLSNRMMTPIQQRGLHQFNSQLVGQKLDTTANVDHHENDEERKSESSSHGVVQQQHSAVQPTSLTSTRKTNSSQKKKTISPSLEEVSPRQGLPQQNDNIEEDEMEPMQEMNISLESAREEEKSHELSQNMSPPYQHRSGHSKDRQQANTNRSEQQEEQLNASQTKKSQGQYQSPDTGNYDSDNDIDPAATAPEMNERVELNEGDEDVENDESEPNEEGEEENRNVEEVLQGLEDAIQENDENTSTVEQEHVEIEEELKEEPNAEEDFMVPQPVVEYENYGHEDEQATNDQAMLLSPTNQQTQNSHHHAHHQAHPHTSHNHLQNPHTVAFESDEEDSQQYDLLPINQSRSGSNTHVVPASTNVQSSSLPHSNSRNRYYESGGDEEDEALDPFANNLRDGAQDIDDEELLAQQEIDPVVEFLEQNSDNDVEEDFDGAPFEAAPISSRFEDEADLDNNMVHRPSLHQNQDRRHSQLEEEDDPGVQGIQHETISSQRNSEMSAGNVLGGRESRGSGSLNIDHNNDNIEEDEAPFEEFDDGAAALANEEERPPAIRRSVSPNHFDQRSEHNGQIDEIKSSSNMEESKHESPMKMVDADDWNLDDLEDSKEAQEEEDASNPDGENYQEHLMDDDIAIKEQKSAEVTDWMLEQEIIKCIQAALALKNNRWY